MHWNCWVRAFKKKIVRHKTRGRNGRIKYSLGPIKRSSGLTISNSAVLGPFLHPGNLGARSRAPPPRDVGKFWTSAELRQRMQEWQDPSTADEQGIKDAERLKQTLGATLAAKRFFRDAKWPNRSKSPAVPWMPVQSRVRFVLFLSSHANHHQEEEEQTLSELRTRKLEDDPWCTTMMEDKQVQNVGL